MKMCRIPGSRARGRREAAERGDHIRSLLSGAGTWDTEYWRGFIEPARDGLHLAKYVNNLKPSSWKRPV